MISSLALTLALQAGLYHCPNDPNICDQEVRTYYSGNTLTHLKVEYVGWCGSMGPYLYPCNGNICSDGNAEFVILDQAKFKWKNLGYPFECEMEHGSK